VKEPFGIIPLKPPFKMTVTFRGRNGTRTVARASHPDSMAALMNLPLKSVPQGRLRRRATDHGTKRMKL